MKFDYQIAFLGGGPAGYVGAIRAAQLGFKTVVIDKDNLGGICLNWGCIPTKSLLKNAEIFDIVKNHSADFGMSFKEVSFDFAQVIARSRDISAKITKNVELLVKKNKIERVRGFGKLTSPHQIEVSFSDGSAPKTITSERIIIATGASPRIVPQIPVDHETVITSTEAMNLRRQPRHLVIIGAGAIGVEFAYFYSVLGTKVTLIEMQERILPVEDTDVSAALEKSFTKRGMTVKTSAIVKSVSVRRKKAKIVIVKNGKEETIEADNVLSAIGVVGNIGGMGLEHVGVKTERNHILVDKTTYTTSVPSVYAVGDVIGPPWLAHVASAEAISCVEQIAGHNKSKVDYDAIPGCTYCHPQVASLGLTEAKAREAGYELKVGRFPFVASGKAFAIGERDGFVKLIFDAKYGELLGAHIIGPDATELIAELGMAKRLEATAETIIKTVHAHPTLSEAVMEAAAAAYGEAIHI